MEGGESGMMGRIQMKSVGVKDTGKGVQAAVLGGHEGTSLIGMNASH